MQLEASGGDGERPYGDRGAVGIGPAGKLGVLRPQRVTYRGTAATWRLVVGDAARVAGRPSALKGRLGCLG